jgi:predicted branched-subunit amino acid permease
VPKSWSLDYALPLTFIALLVPSIEDRSGTMAAVVAALMAVIGSGLPLKLGLMLAALAGISVGVVCDWTARQQSL